MLTAPIPLAVFGLAALASAHIKMTTPTPFGASTLNNSPLLADGSDFPCKQREGVYDAAGASNTWPLGSTQSLAFEGSAVHGGGSCQVSISYDEAPTASSTWKVIHSIEGGCPMKGIAGNNGDNANAVVPDTYPFTVPSSLPTGTAVMAWTWFNKVGNREMYMNCAPVTITSGTSKRGEDEVLADSITQLRERDTSAYDALPAMFVANIGSSCHTVDSADVVFPSPGDSLDLDGTADSLKAPTGCAAGSGSGSGSSSGSAPATSPGYAGFPLSSATTTPSSAAGLPGGVFATVPAAGANPYPTTLSPVVSAAPASSDPALASYPVASAVSSSAPNSAASSASASTPVTGATKAPGSACSTEGEWNCISGTSFQQCASGTWSAVQQVAAGTNCGGGESAAMNIYALAGTKKKARRAARFSREHIRQHIHRS
ncbi:hypothetical protein QTJ16_000614 [Diplocarpon rosae]|uniref:Lytic polysaccharide monooxygenase n=1 Tax=Diplocarpon rosae TaxID=946125 RepID=A0AAD9WHR1_9HELO|nr:hypothetical protein QTJ16_000614 [Diplocarpon rosae]